MLSLVMKLITKIPSVAIIAAVLFGFAPKTSAATPSVVTGSATSISSSSATFNGQVDPNGSATDYWFEYGTSDFTHSTSSASAGSGDSLTSYSKTVGSLQSGTSYNFRIVAKNSDGIRYGNTKTFTTSSAPAPSVPSVLTGTASSVTSSSAVINGQVNPNGSAARYWFEYALSSSSSFTSTSSSSAGSGSSLASYSKTLSGLQAGTAYKFRIVAQSDSGTEIRYGNTVTFSTSSSPNPTPSVPSVLTTDATGIYSSSATLNGQVDCNGTSARYWFEFAPNSSGTFSSTSSASAGSGDSLISYSRTVSGLQSGTVYKFRIVAQSDSGTEIRYGNTKTFTTSSSSDPVDPSASAPSVLTGGVSNVSSYSAVFNGSVDPNNASTEYWFEYGISDFNLSTSRSSVGSGNGLTSVSLSVSGLSASTTYNYRIVGRNSVDIRYGSTRTFTTSSGGYINPTGGAPTVSLSSAYGVTKDSATFQGYVNPNGTWTEYWFEYGVNNGDFSQKTTRWSVSNSVWSTAVTTSVYNLAGNTTYYYRLAAQNSYGAAYSSVMSFTTGNGGSYYGAPYISTNNATNIYDTSAVLNGEVTTNNSETTVWFEYGYAGQGLNRSSSSVTYPASSSARVSSISIAGLSKGTRYDFRAVARNTYGTVYGEIRSFTASGNGSQTGSPIVSTGNATGITKNAAILWANVNPQNSSSSLWFEYGTSAFSLNFKSSGYTVPSYTGAKDYYNSISGLQADTLYFYRSVAQNAYGTNRGEVKFFRTSSGGTIITEPPVIEPPVVEPSEDLNVFLDPSLSNLEPKSGDTVDYVLTYRNASKGKITAASLKVTLPFESEYADASAVPTSRMGNNLVFYIGDVEKGSQGAVIIKAKVKDDAEAGSSLMFNSVLEFTDSAKEFQTVTSFISATVEAGENVGFLASLSAFARSVSGSWLFWLLFLIMLITIIYLVVSRRKEKKAAAAAVAAANAAQHNQ